MKKLNGWLLPLWTALLCHGAHAETIEEVLLRSQQTRLETLRTAPADAAPAVALRQSWARLQEVVRPDRPVELRIVEAGAVAETMLGRIVVMNVSLGELPEVCRLFVLAHELGHVAQRHWDDRVALYREHIPGAVVPEATDAVAPQLGRAASRQSHQHEFDADAYAMNLLLDMGYGRDELIEMFRRLGQHTTTATHPSSARRLMHLRSIEDGRRLARLSPPPGY